MILGLDFYGTAKTFPQWFLPLAQWNKTQGGKTYIISVVLPKNRERTIVDIQALVVPHDEAIVIGTKDLKDAPMLKLEVCKKLGVQLFFDDYKDTCDYLNRRGILTVHVA